MELLRLSCFLSSDWWTDTKRFLFTESWHVFLCPVSRMGEVFRAETGQCLAESANELEASKPWRTCLCTFRLLFYRL